MERSEDVSAFRHSVGRTLCAESFRPGLHARHFDARRFLALHLACRPNFVRHARGLGPKNKSQKLSGARCAPEAGRGLIFSTANVDVHERSLWIGALSD